jgi:hypothetical protein
VDNLYALELLAILGGSEDLQRMTSIAKAAELGPARYKLLGSYGHPALVEWLLAELANPDPATAVAAGAAFSKITGQDIDSKDRVPLRPGDGKEPDEFQAEFLEEVVLPSPAAARIHWDKVKPGLARATRLCKGIDVSRGATPDALAKLDMESRWELLLRSRFHGAWSGSPADLERFPQSHS